MCVCVTGLASWCLGDYRSKGRAGGCLTCWLPLSLPASLETSVQTRRSPGGSMYPVFKVSDPKNNQKHDFGNLKPPILDA